MTQQQIALVALELIAWALVLVFLVAALLRAREEKHKYKLYALRDSLLYLMATGKIEEEDRLFKAFYSALTKSIKEVNRLTIYNLIRASVSAKKALETEKEDWFFEAIKRASPEVQDFMSEFAQTMMRIILTNSPTLRLVILVVNKCGVLLRGIKHSVRMPAEAYETYQTYRYFERLAAHA